MGDFGWQNWSQFGEVQVGVDKVAGASRVVTANLNYQDTWHGALGAQYRASDKWQFTGGVAFDSSAVNSANRTVTLAHGPGLAVSASAPLTSSAAPSTSTPAMSSCGPAIWQ